MISKTPFQGTWATPTNGQGQGFAYPIPPTPMGGWDYDYCIYMRNLASDAIVKALNSGTYEYHVGSRGLKRFTLRELQDMLGFWSNAAADAALGTYSAIQTRRAVPCDV